MSKAFLVRRGVAQSGVIEVTQLPTENIDEKAVYYIPSENSHNRYEKCTELITHMGDSGAIPMGTYPLSVVATKPTENIKAYTDSYKHIYYVEDENDMFMYSLSETSGMYEWLSVSTLFGVEFKGFVDGLSGATEEGLFAVTPHYEWFKYSILGGDLEVTTEEKTVTPTKEVQEVVPTEAGYLSKVTVNPIPNEYIIPNGNLIITDNGTKDVTKYVSVTVNVPTSGGSTECSGNHIIEVDTLPTENIDENVLYKCGESYYKCAKKLKDLVVVENGTATSMVDMYISYGLTIYLYYVTTKPTENIVPSDWSTGIIAVYYVEDENDAFTYDGSEWSAMGASGVISDTSEAIEDGMYALLSMWKEYLAPSDGITITENGVYDVSQYEKIATSIPSSYMVQTVEDLPTDAVDCSLAIVLRGGE